MARSIDPVTFEVLKNALDSIADQMALIVMRTAYSAIVRDSLDFSTAFCDGEGRMLAQGLTTPLHLGSFPDAMRHVVTEYAGSMEPGDVFALTDPYGAGGMHLPDIYVIKPIFVDGIVAGYAATLTHHSDVGGISPGSNSVHSTEIYQEGLRLPLLKLYVREEPNQTLLRIIEKNTRLPGKVLGDLRAQVAACHSAERAFTQLAARYGAVTLRDYFDEMLAYSERMMRAEIEALPDGVSEFVDFIDGLGEDPEPIRFQVKVTVAKDEIKVDWTGTSAQVKAGINTPLPFTRSACYLVLRSVIGGDLPNNEGYMRPIHVVAPSGTIVNSVEPAACATRGITGFRIIDTLLGALAQVVPDRVPAAGEGGVSWPSIGGYVAGKPFIYVESILGTWGGRPGRDGCEGVSNLGANQSNQPVEVIEAELPLQVIRYEMVADSGGAGQFRGGLALLREYQLLADEAVLTMRSDRRAHPPYGLHGGKPGTPSWNILNPGADQRVLPVLPMEAVPLKRGDRFLHIQAGGGGYGPALLRSPQAVHEDVLDEKLSLDFARCQYGVVIDPVTRRLDMEATGRLRNEMRLLEQECAAADSGPPAQDANLKDQSPRPRISARVRNVSRVVSRETGELVLAHEMQGKEVLKLYGAPFWLPPDHVLEAAARAVTEVAGAPSSGLPELRRAIAVKMERDNGCVVDPEREILITNAAMHALSIVFTVLLDPGDEVVLLSPAFFFSGLIKLAGGIPVYVPTREEHLWQWDVAGLEAAVTPRTKLIIINTPANPTGYVASRDDLEAVADLARRRDLLVLSDEAYENMLYDGARHISFASLPGAKDRTISVFSFTKSHALKQWRVGFVAAPATMTPHLVKVLEWNVLACNHVAQRAALAALEGPQDWIRDISLRYQHFRDLMMTGLREAPKLSFVVPRGAPFLFIRVSELGVSGEEFMRFLLDEYGVPTDPGAPFEAGAYVRLSFGGEDRQVAEAARRISLAARRLDAQYSGAA